MIAVVMGIEDSCQLEFVGVEKRDQGLRFARIDSDGVAAVVQHPDVIVVERRQGNECQHGKSVKQEKGYVIQAGYRMV